MSYYLIGHYGSGKTMLAAEVVKIWLGRFLETYREVDAFVLTYDSKSELFDRCSRWGFNYDLLIQELRDKYFPHENQVQVSHWSEFMEQQVLDQLVKYVDGSDGKPGYFTSPLPLKPFEPPLRP